MAYVCSWPAVKAMEEKATDFLDAALQDAARGLRDAQPGLSDAAQSMIGTANHRVAGHLSELVYGNYKHNELDIDAIYGKYIGVLLLIECLECH